MVLLEVIDQCGGAYSKSLKKLWSAQSLARMVIGLIGSAVFQAQKFNKLWFRNNDWEFESVNTAEVNIQTFRREEVQRSIT